MDKVSVQKAGNNNGGDQGETIALSKNELSDIKDKLFKIHAMSDIAYSAVTGGLESRPNNKTSDLGMSACDIIYDYAESCLEYLESKGIA